MSQKCFLCDNLTSKNSHPLAFYHSKGDKKPLVETLAKLLGDRMMVVCRSDDVVCESCIDLLEASNNLEQQLLAKRNEIAGFLDRKYSITTGTDEEVEPGVGSKIKEESQCIDGNGKALSNFEIRKLKSREELEKLSEKINSDPRSKIVLKCSTCHYTTNYMEFEKRHVQGSSHRNAEAAVKDSTCSLPSHEVSLESKAPYIIVEDGTEMVMGREIEEDSYLGDLESSVIYPTQEGTIVVWESKESDY